MAIDLSGRTAFVTGGGRGIGRAISLGLARAGADVALNYTRNADAANEVAEEIRALGRRAEAYQGDIADFASCQAMAEAALADFGSISILVNNGGVASRGNTVVETDPEEMRRVVNTHAMGSYHMSRALVPQMREQPRGDVVMISSVAAQGLAARGAPYNMGKAAQEAIAYTLAKEERPHGIHVNVVAPGLVDTDMGRRLARATRGVADIHELDERSPFGRVCAPEDIADAVVFLCSGDAAYVTGQRITVNGGGF
ncbi:MAG: SDR family oxidoreductase [Dehalococcoidia bacterium]|nr:SDR family oxidoreductase [Dehalococcoidia bacterium]